MKHQRSVFFIPSEANFSISEHLALLCQILDAATESEVLEAELTDVA